MVRDDVGRIQSQKFLGSIDYISAETVQAQLDLMSPASNIGGAERVGENERRSVAPLPEFDLCVMNPPFVRSVGGNLLFGSVPDQRGLMQKELARRLPDLAPSDRCLRANQSYADTRSGGKNHRPRWKSNSNSNCCRPSVSSLDAL